MQEISRSHKIIIIIIVIIVKKNNKKTDIRDFSEST